MAIAPGALESELEFNVLDDIGSIRVADIDVDAQLRLRAVDPVWADALGLAMLREGQATPIVVCRLPGRARWTLVAGAHRVAGAKKHDIEYLRAEVISPRTHERAQREISENLWRRGLDPAERAAFIAKLVSLRSVQAGSDEAKRRQACVPTKWKEELSKDSAEAWKSISNVYGFSNEVGEQLGMTGRMIRRDLLLHRRLIPSIVADLRTAGHPVAGNATQLCALAKLDETEQRGVAGQLVRFGRKTVAEALSYYRGAPKRVQSPEEKRYSAFTGAFERMSLAERKGALGALVQYLPAGFRLVEGDASAPKAGFPAEHARYREETLEALDAALLFLDGVEEDDALPGERGAEIGPISSALRIARLTIGGNGFALSAAVAASPTPPPARPATGDIPALIAMIEDYLEDHDAGWIVGRLIEDEGAEAGFVNGTYELKLARVKATCTAGGAGLLKAWIKLARKRLEQGA